jgi:hypothetical protein
VLCRTAVPDSDKMTSPPKVARATFSVYWRLQNMTILWPAHAARESLDAAVRKLRLTAEAGWGGI